jgi:hypothetical protein
MPPSALTPENSTIVMIDHAVGFGNVFRSHDLSLHVNNTVGLARTAGVFDIPLVLTNGVDTGPYGPLFSELRAVTGGTRVIVREANFINRGERAYQRGRPHTGLHGRAAAPGIKPLGHREHGKYRHPSHAQPRPIQRDDYLHYHKPPIRRSHHRREIRRRAGASQRTVQPRPSAALRTGRPARDHLQRSRRTGVLTAIAPTG